MQQALARSAAREKRQRDLCARNDQIRSFVQGGADRDKIAALFGISQEKIARIGASR
ncbi:hypothetical protein [Sphingobium indicum]|uniref:hypothetical protein n=1 Tax=Sphingobium indicum TaxID=332055 RepID=UPI0012FF22B1|nr:hypothetical protein [Sphingobium indicum]